MNAIKKRIMLYGVLVGILLITTFPALRQKIIIIKIDPKKILLDNVVAEIQYLRINSSIKNDQELIEKSIETLASNPRFSADQRRLLNSVKITKSDSDQLEISLESYTRTIRKIK